MAVMELLAFQLGEVPQLLAKIYLALIGSQVVAVVVDFMDSELAVMVAVEMVLDKMCHKVMTSYNGNIRKQFAGIKYTYDAVNDVFIAPQPYPSWALDNDFNWQPPTPRPEGINWYWNEVEQVWIDANEL
jgi:hypothetical protein